MDELRRRHVLYSTETWMCLFLFYFVHLVYFYLGGNSILYLQIWDVLSNKEVVEIVAASPRPSAARALVELANRAWKFKYPYAKTDDCAVVCLFLTSGASVNTSLTTPEGKVNSLEVVDVGGDSLIV